MLAKIQALIASIEAKYAAIKAAIIAAVPSMKLSAASAAIGSILTLVVKYLLKI